MRKLSPLLLLTILMLTGCASASTPSPAKTLTVFAAASLNGAFTELGKSFESAHPGVKVAFNFAGSQTLSAQLLQGAPADVFASANHTEMDRLVSTGLVACELSEGFCDQSAGGYPASKQPRRPGFSGGSRPPGLEIGSRRCLPSQPANTLARFSTISARIPPYGPDFSSKVLANVVSNETDVEVVVTKVQLGEADAGIVYISDSVAFPNFENHSIPDNFNVIAKYPIAVLAKAPQPGSGGRIRGFSPITGRTGYFEEVGLYPGCPLGMVQLRHSSRTSSFTRHRGWIFILPSLLMLGLLGLPLFALLWRAVGKDFFQNALSPTAMAALRLSLGTSAVTVLIAIVTGTPLAFLLARWKFRGKAAVELLIDLPVTLPPSVAGLSLLLAFGRQGIFGGWLAAVGISLPFTTAAVILAQTFVSTPLFIRSARLGFAGIERQLEEAATVEGADEWQIFRFIMFPLAGRAFLTGLILTWTRALGEFGATLLFAGNLIGKTQTMPLAIYLGFEQGIGVAIALSVMLLTCFHLSPGRHPPPRKSGRSLLPRNVILPPSRRPAGPAGLSRRAIPRPGLTRDLLKVQNSDFEKAINLTYFILPFPCKQDYNYRNYT